MGFLDSLRGGSNKDGMRETTSLTMAYLLDQNARFEAFMQQKVETLEAIVAQQQARSSAVEGQPPEEGAAAWPEPKWDAVEPGGELERPFPDSDLGEAPEQEETRPVPVVGQFVLDDVVSSGDMPLASVSESPMGERTAPIEPAAMVSPVVDPDEPGQPLNWQAMLLGQPEEKNNEVDTPVALDEDARAEGAAGSEMEGDMLTEEEFNEMDPIPDSSQTQTDLRPSADDKKEAPGEKQAALPVEVVGDDEAWDTSLEQTGPVEQWA